MTATHPHACASPSGSFGNHPLEIFPIFRRIPPSIPRDFIYTLIWNSMFALAFTVLNVIFDPRETFVGAFWPIFVFAQCIGYIIHFSFVIGNRVLPGIRTRGVVVRALYISIVPLFGTFAGYWLGTTLLHFDAMRTWVFSPHGALSVGMLSLVISGVLLLIFVPRERAARLQVEVEREQTRASVAEKQTTLARLKLLEAQVEPHFLYNTLANVVSLIDTEPATAKAMIERLIALLRGAAAAAGTTNSTLAAQVEHLRAYLELLALRMGGRLAFRIDVPPALAGISVPPLLVQPLVENAIRHGLEPKIGGGEVAVAARRDGDWLELTVIDNGVGFAATKSAPTKGSGLGLGNLRERLAAIYGDAASVVIEDNAPAGARITLRLPLTAAA